MTKAIVEILSLVAIIAAAAAALILIGIAQNV